MDCNRLSTHTVISKNAKTPQRCSLLIHRMLLNFVLAGLKKPYALFNLFNIESINIYVYNRHKLFNNFQVNVM